MDKYATWTPPVGSPFLTVTLNPQWYSRKAADQFKQTKDMLKNILKKFSDEFIMVAELTKQGNVHYHGWIKYRNSHDMIDIHLLDTLKVIGLSHMKKIDNVEGSQKKTLEYMFKNWNATRQFISNPIVRYRKKQNKWLSEEQEGATPPPPHDKPQYRKHYINIVDDYSSLDENIVLIDIEVPQGTE